MSTIHLYTAPLQPATNFVDRTMEKPFRFRFPPRALLWCRNCNQRRWARNMNVQVFYDDIRFFCIDKAKCVADKRKYKAYRL